MVSSRPVDGAFWIRWLENNDEDPGFIMKDPPSTLLSLAKPCHALQGCSAIPLALSEPSLQQKSLVVLNLSKDHLDHQLTMAAFHHSLRRTITNL